MTKNMGNIDRILRLIVGAALIAYALGYFGAGPYTWVGWIGVVPLLTALVGSCPAYSLFGISSCPAKKDS
ncbi:MAG: DUF2892 domain-containing protein [Rhizobiaceae bacterium]|nr:DUF2892 domain-containing protein [Rhizobiaceae bacterium]